MEDIRRRVEYKNLSIQLQAVERLYGEVKKKRPAGATLTSSTPEYAELQLLWQLAGASESAVSRLSCQFLVQLLKDGVADFTYILNGFLNIVPSVKNLSGLIEAVGQLLILQLQVKLKAGEEYVCPYTIKTPPHPFITIVTNRPTESWPLLLDHVTLMLNQSPKGVREHILTMLDPFLKFILLDPKHTELNAHLRSELRITLITTTSNMADTATKNRYFSYTLDMLLHQQLGCPEDVAFATQFCVHLMNFYSRHGDDLEMTEGQRLSLYATTLAEKNQDYGLSCHTLVSGLAKICQIHSQLLCQNTALVMLGSLLLSTTGPVRMDLLHIVKAILKSDSSLSPTCVGFVVMATINILSTTPTTAMVTSHKMMTSLATDIITTVQTILKGGKCEKSDHLVMLDSAQMSSCGYEAQTCVQLATQFSSNPTSLTLWLTNLQPHICRLTVVPVSMVNLLVSCLISSADTRTGSLVVDRLVDVVKQDPTQGPSLLPVLLYVLGRKSCPSLRLCLLEAIPKMATHKYNVPIVLKTILSLASVAQMKALSVRLLTDLWTLQDRCFPHLLKVITEGTHAATVTMETVPSDVLLAQAHAIKEVCRLRPEQHGTDMLAPLSDLLNMCTDGRSAPVAALALEALFYICQAEVIDLMSAWGVLESCLIKESRPVVVVKICELLSLVPDLQVKTDEYEVFASETVRRLWLYTQTEQVAVVTAAYTALASFSVEHFKISHFQYKTVADLIQQAEAMMAAQEVEKGEVEKPKMSVDDMIPAVPGICYVRLMTDLPPEVLTGYEAFLSQKVAEEANNLPRGIYYTSLRQPGTSTNQGKALKSLPSNIQSLYEKTKHPGLRPELAVALLSCYNPTVEVGRDGRPRKHNLMSHGKLFQQMFSALLDDVTVQPSNWHKLVTLPQAWASFVERLFSSMMEARKAEIDLQLNRGMVDENEAEQKKASAWFWVRDNIMNTVKKNATKGSPSVQCNAILSLAGLASVTQRYVTSMEAKERKDMEVGQEYTSHSHWLMMVIDSCMSIMDFTFKPKSTLLGLCQQRSVDDRHPASVLAQAAAILALAQLVPVIMTNYIELVYTLLPYLSERLPGQPGSIDCPPVLQTFYGLGLGSLLARLVQERFSDLEGTKGSLEVMKALDALEESSYSSDDNRTGDLLGLSQCLAALCQDGNTESRVHVSSVHGRLATLLKDMPARDQAFQPLCVCLSVLTGAGFSSNCLDIQRADDTLHLLKQLFSDNSESYGLSLSIGLLCDSLQQAGHPNVSSVTSALVSDWTHSLKQQATSTLTRLASLAGITAIVGSERPLLMVDDSSTMTDTSGPSVDMVVTMVYSLITNTDNTAVAGTAAWLLGNLHLATCSTNQNKSTVPSTYSYLPETSIMRSVIDFLIKSGKQGPEFVPSPLIELCLKSLQREVTATLPPLNWTGVLSPLMKMPFDETVKLGCIRLAVKLCSSATSAALFLSSWIVPPLFNTLSISCQLELLTSCGQFLKTVTPAVLQTFLDKSLKPAIITSGQGRSLCLAALKGLNSSLQVLDPPQAVTAMLYQAARYVFAALEGATDPDVLCHLSECLSHLPDTVFDDITAADCTSAASILRGTFVRSYLVARGRQPIPLLNSCIDAAFNLPCDQQTVLYYLCQCFSYMTRSDTKNTRPSVRLHWLLEIMGHVRNIAVGNVPLSAPNSDLCKVISFAVKIIASALCLWTSTESAGVMGLNFNLLTFKDKFNWSTADMEDCDWLESCHIAIPPEDLLVKLEGNVNEDPWSQVVPKLLEWLLSMCTDQKVNLTPHVKTKLSRCLLSFRDSTDYARMAVWTKAVMAI